MQLAIGQANIPLLGDDVCRLITLCLAFLPPALVAACSSTVPDNAPAWPPANYREIIRHSKAEIPDALTKGAQVSEPRKTIAPQIYDWVVCLKSDMKPNTSFFAVFFQGEKIQMVRQSVQIDQCEIADYSPLTPPVSPPGQKVQIKRKT
jgi:hypothetical protein